MNCPYCAEEIKDEAIVCKHCQRDFFIIRPLLNTLNEMSKRIEILENNASAPPLLTNSSASRSASLDFSPSSAGKPNDHLIPTLPPIAAMTLCIITLVVAHFFIVIQFDMDLPYLRAALFVIPLIFGLVYQQGSQKPLLYEFGAGLLVAIASTLAMLVIVSKVDRVSVFPDDLQQWRELGYYVASISFGFFTGALIQQIVVAARSSTPNSGKIIARTSQYIAARIVSGDETKLEKNLKRIHGMISTAIALGSAVIAIASSLSITGNH